jgi:hypothetical protein
MNNYFGLNTEQQKIIITQTAVKTNLPLQAIEKDLWVTTVLQVLFSLPISKNLVFKGGTSLSKVWGIIKRFSEDIDLAIDRQQFSIEGDLTVKQLKKLRKQSSVFVREELCKSLQDAIIKAGIQDLCIIEAEPDGEGDKTYPEPRKIYVRYQSLFNELGYLKSEIVLEVGARSLIEPTASHPVRSIISENFDIETTLTNPDITTALPEKTFLEKVFLLYEIFSGAGIMQADRKSRHLYDLEKMMDNEFAVKAISDDDLWGAIHHHREVFTRMNGVDYTPDIRRRICLIPPQSVIDDWRKDYETMQNAMIYGDSLSFDKLLNRMEELQNRFRIQK